MGHEEGAIVGRDFARFLITDSHGMARFEREGLARNPLRVLQIPFLDGEDAPMLVALIDEEENSQPAIGESAAAHIKSLVSLMPFGVALIGADGRFVQMNDAFARAAAVDPHSPPIYPGDLLVREDLLQLFGFATLVEKEWHRLLTSVQGVGAKVSLALLGALGPDGVSRAIALGDWNAVKAAKGVGPKTAQRIVLDLKDKAPAVMAMGGEPGGAFPASRSAGLWRRGSEQSARAGQAAQAPASTSPFSWTSKSRPNW